MAKKLYGHLIVFLAFGALIGSCKRDPSVNTNPAVSKVKMAITTSATLVPDTVIYSYDSLDRQVQSQTDSAVTTYAYSQGSVQMTIALAGDNFTTIYYTNTLGLATSDSKGNGYAYDANSYLITQWHTASGSTDSIFYRVHSGDADTVIQHQADSLTGNAVTTIYSYLPNTDSRNYGTAFLGTPDKNLVQTETITQVINGGSYSISYNYSYTFDASGRVIQQVMTSGSASYTTSYTYY